MTRVRDREVERHEHRIAMDQRLNNSKLEQTVGMRKLPR